ncbi:NUDIX hydrolase [Actinomadura rubrobrunea]|uniref:NUDIX hydrolase n=1 Tax=Actinomadura rubrobrunea TaxID=115335 RepID=A0A9W6PYK3_9ACTN|nr:NUDIX domain-containing protein [Actinomadura rubrobrunea]GLW66480.1 NUDIX hydrolase [Actinomadura rubrobrunea]
MPDSRHSVSVAGVVVDDRRRALLIQRRDNGHWEAPGGVLERDEDIISGLKREVLEETGLHVTPTALTGIYKNMARGIVALVFRCTVEGGTLTPSDESKDFRWASAEEVKHLATEAFAIRVLDALSDLPTVPIRRHDGVHLIP